MERKSGSNKLMLVATEVVMFMVMFLLLGTLIPRFIVMFTPASHYYTITSPAITDKDVYKSGERMVLTADRESKISIHASSVQKLILINRNNGKERVFSSEYSIPIVEGEKIVAVHMDLPNGIPSGEYYWQGIVTFSIDGVQKEYPWYSVSFRIEQ